MGHTWAALGVMAAVTLATAWVSQRGSARRTDLTGAAFVLFMAWPLNELCEHVLNPPERMLLGPIYDAMFATALWNSARGRFQAWQLALSSLLVLQAIFHITYQTSSDRPGALHRYMIELNLTYALQLLCIFSLGARDVVLHLGDRDLHRRGGPPVARRAE